MDKLDSYERSVEIAQSIVDLQESRIPLGTATSADVSSSSVDLVNTKNLRDTAQTDAKAALYTLNVLLGDPAGKQYRIEEEIKFLPIKVTEQVLFNTYLNESPNIKNARKDITKSQMGLELAEKNMLPLPTIKFSGVTVGYNNGYYGNQPEYFTQAAGNSNFDVFAVVSLSVPLTGPGGLFGSRTIETSEIQVDQNELRFRNTVNKDHQQILQLIQNIRQFETTVDNNHQNYTSSMDVLESVFNKFATTRTVSRLDIRDAINQARDSEIALDEAILSHLNFKTQLAAFIGVDYLPRME